MSIVYDYKAIATAMRPEDWWPKKKGGTVKVKLDVAAIVETNRFLQNLLQASGDPSRWENVKVGSKMTVELPPERLIARESILPNGRESTAIVIGDCSNGVS